MTSKKEVRTAEYTDFPLRDGTFSAGQDDGTSISAGDVGEFATAEVGEDGALSDYIGVIVGQNPDEAARSGEAKVLLDPNNGSANRLAESTELKLVVRKKGERGGKDLTRWFEIRDNGPTTNADLRSILKPRPPAVKDGRIIAVHIRNQDTSITPSLSDSTFKWPVQGGQ